MPTKKNLLGAHMSIAGGIDQAFYRGHSINCTTIQIFTHSNRQWHCKPLTEDTIEKVKVAQKETGINSVAVHASYLINLGSSTHDVQKKSITTLEQELTNCDQLSIPYLILHPGGSSGKSEEDCIDEIAESINIIFQKHKSKIMILLENMAGQGSSVCYKFEQLHTLRQKVEDKKRIGFCFDTAHAWAAGYDFSNEKSYHKMWKDYDSIIGIEHLKAMHLNDSLKKLGSRVDRHADIGKGTMGLETFKLIMNDKKFVTIPKILETPTDTLPGYAHNLEILNKLVD